MNLILWGGIAATSLAGLLLASLWNRAQAERDVARLELARLRGRIHLADRWLCHEFPEIEAACDWLLERPDEHPSELRARLREMRPATTEADA